jgi:flagellar biosynthetic protein FliP
VTAAGRLLAVAWLAAAALLASAGPALAGPPRPPAGPVAALPGPPPATPYALTAPAAAAVPYPRAAPGDPVGPTAPAGPKTPTSTTVTVNVPGAGTKPSTSIVILIALTLLSVAPAMLLLCTSFTKVFVVLSITRNALGLTNVPPNQVIAGLALFLSLFIMGPVFAAVNDIGVQPYLAGDKTQTQAFSDGLVPLRTFMLKHTRPDEIALLTKVAGDPLPRTPESIPITTLIPAFVLSELRAALIIGFAIYVPFLVIDMVVSAALMSMGMMMLPPVTVSLPFKLLLFVLANGWGLVVTALVASYH